MFGAGRGNFTKDNLTESMKKSKSRVTEANSNYNWNVVAKIKNLKLSKQKDDLFMLKLSIIKNYECQDILTFILFSFIKRNIIDLSW